MAQPQTPPEPPRGTPGVPAVAGSAAALGAAAAAGVGAVGIAPPGAAVPALTGAAVAAIVKGFDTYAASRGRLDEELLLLLLDERYPSRPPEEKREVVDEEARYSREFRQNQRRRLRIGLAEAGRIPDPTRRREAIRGLLGRERHYTRMHHEASAVRTIAHEEVRLLQELSPEGAYWKLSPNVSEHTLDCLVMGEKFWPWEVLRAVHPPLHYGCPCELYGLDEAVQMGLMRRQDLPDKADAIRRAKRLAREVPELRERWGEAALREAALELSEASVRGALHRLRWPKGYEHGGEYRPRRGGSAGRRILRDLRSVLPEGAPRAASRSRGERWVAVRGVQHRVPEGRRWEHRAPDGTLFHSPPGSLNVYRNGELASEPGARPRHADLGGQAQEENIGRPRARSRGREARDKVEAERPAARSAASARSKDRGSPVAPGDPASALAAIEDEGWRPVARDPALSQVTYRHDETGRTLTVTLEGGEVSSATYEAGEPGVKARRATATPLTWEDFRADALALANELSLAHGSPNAIADLEEDRWSHDIAGAYMPDGTAYLGPEAREVVERVAQLRARGEAVEGRDAADAWYAAQVAAHEVIHSVSPPDWALYSGVPEERALEEGITEELSHAIAADRLRERGDLDILRWARDHPSSPDAQGAYPQYRTGLAQVLDAAGVAPEQRRALLEHLSFEAEPSERMGLLANLVAAHQGVEPEAARLFIGDAMLHGGTGAHPDIDAPVPASFSLAPDGRGLGEADTPRAVRTAAGRVGPGARVRVAPLNSESGPTEAEVREVLEAEGERPAMVLLDTPQGPGMASLDSLELLDEADSVAGLRLGEGDVVRWRNPDGSDSEGVVASVARRGPRWELRAVTTEASGLPGEHVVLSPERARDLHLSGEQVAARETQRPPGPEVGSAAAPAVGSLRSEGDAGSVSGSAPVPPDTGHYGTGVRFTSSPDRLSPGRDDRVAGVDLAGLNLFRPRDEAAAMDLHSALLGVNWAAGSDGDIPDHLELGRLSEELNAAGVSTTPERLGLAIRAAAADLAQGRAGADSASTRAMRDAGFDGVDTRHLDETVDNPLFGSVVYRPAEQSRASAAAGAESPGRAAVVDGTEGFHLFIEGHGWQFVPTDRDWQLRVPTGGALGDLVWSSPAGTKEVWLHDPAKGHKPGPQVSGGEADLVKAPGRRATDDRLIPPSKRGKKDRSGTAPAKKPLGEGPAGGGDAEALAREMRGLEMHEARDLAQRRGYAYFTTYTVYPDGRVVDGNAAARSTDTPSAFRTAHRDYRTGAEVWYDMPADQSAEPGGFKRVKDSGASVNERHIGEAAPPDADTPERLAWELRGSMWNTEAARRLEDSGYVLGTFSADPDGNGDEGWHSATNPDTGATIVAHVTRDLEVDDSDVWDPSARDAESAKAVLWNKDPLGRISPGMVLDGEPGSVRALLTGSSGGGKPMTERVEGGTVYTTRTTAEGRWEKAFPSRYQLPEGWDGYIDFGRSGEDSGFIRVGFKRESGEPGTQGRLVVAAAGRPNPDRAGILPDAEYQTLLRERRQAAREAKAEERASRLEKLNRRADEGKRFVDVGDTIRFDDLAGSDFVTHWSRARRPRSQQMRDSVRTANRTLKLRHVESGATQQLVVEVTEGGGFMGGGPTEVRVVRTTNWQRGSLGRGRSRVTGRMPSTANERLEDVLGRADEMGERYGAKVEASTVYWDRGEGFGGVHEWDGVVRTGRATRSALDAAAKKKAKGEQLTPAEAARVYSAYKVLQHEINHAVNPITSPEYSGAGITMEEALTEELAHVEMVDWLRSHGLDEVVARAANNPGDGEVEGTYKFFRQLLRDELDRAQVPEAERLELLAEMKFRMGQEERFAELARRAGEANGTDPAEELSRIRGSWYIRSPQQGARRYVRGGFRPILSADYGDVPLTEATLGDGTTVTAGGLVEYDRTLPPGEGNIGETEPTVGRVVGMDPGEDDGAQTVKVRFEDGATVWTSPNSLRSPGEGSFVGALSPGRPDLPTGPEDPAAADVPLAEYLGPEPPPREQLSEDEWRAAWTRRAARERVWERAVVYRIAMGQLGPEEAEGMGLARSLAGVGQHRPWEPLPPELYHVTTAPEDVSRVGALLSREELNLQLGEGLGAGDDATISTTADPALARRIAEGMIEAARAVRGELTVREMLDQAERGDGADRPWVEGVVHLFTGDNSWEAGDPLPQRLVDLLDGTERRRSVIGRTREEWEADGYAPAEDSRMGQKYLEATRPIPAETLREDRLQFFKYWSGMRGANGGPPDPLIVSVRADTVAGWRPEGIATVTLRPAPGARGQHFAGLDEWRVPTGDALVMRSIRREDGVTLPVRGAPSPGRATRWVVLVDGHTDSRPSLTPDVAAEQVAQAHARGQRAEARVVAGNNWRLPTPEEQQDLVDRAVALIQTGAQSPGRDRVRIYHTAPIGSAEFIRRNGLRGAPDTDEPGVWAFRSLRDAEDYANDPQERRDIYAAEVDGSRLVDAGGGMVIYPENIPPESLVDPYAGAASPGRPVERRPAEVEGYEDAEELTFATGKRVVVGWQGDQAFVMDPEDERPAEFATAATDWLYEVDPEDYLPQAELSEDFWAGVSAEGELRFYHGTDGARADAIRERGLLAMNETRGITNRGTGAAVFLHPSRTYVEASYAAGREGMSGGALVTVDLAAMKRDGVTPRVGSEEPIVEATMRDSLAWVLGLEDFHDESADYDGLDPETLIVYGDIPPRYLTVEASRG